MGACTSVPILAPFEEDTEHARGDPGCNSGVNSRAGFKVYSGGLASYSTHERRQQQCCGSSSSNGPTDSCRSALWASRPAQNVFEDWDEGWSDSSSSARALEAASSNGCSYGCSGLGNYGEAAAVKWSNDGSSLCSGVRPFKGLPSWPASPAACPGGGPPSCWLPFKGHPPGGRGREEDGAGGRGLAVHSGALLAVGSRSSKVFRGSWGNAPAAVKVMYTHGQEYQARAHAIEMVILSNVQHPNVVQAYSRMTDMVETWEDADESSGDAPCCPPGRPAGSGPRAFYRPARPGDDDEAAAGPGGGPLAGCDILIMELCDGGTLRGAMERGAFFLEDPAGSAAAAAAAALGATHMGLPRVDVVTVVDVLASVASALAYLHAMRMVHGNLKPESVLLKPDYSLGPRGVRAKLGGFSFAQILDDSGRPAVLRHLPGGASDEDEPQDKAEEEATREEDARAFGALILDVLVACGWHDSQCQGAMDARPQGARRCPPSDDPPRPIFRRLARLAAGCASRDPFLRPAMADAARALHRLSEEAAAAAAPRAGAAASLQG